MADEVMQRCEQAAARRARVAECEAPGADWFAQNSAVQSVRISRTRGFIVPASRVTQTPVDGSFHRRARSGASVRRTVSHTTHMTGMLRKTRFTPRHDERTPRCGRRRS